MFIPSRNIPPPINFTVFHDYQVLAAYRIRNASYPRLFLLHSQYAARSFLHDLVTLKWSPSLQPFLPNR